MLIVEQGVNLKEFLSVYISFLKYPLKFFIAKEKDYDTSDLPLGSGAE